MITILLVDDQNLVQQGIKSLLDQDIELKVIGTVKDGRSAIEQINRLRPDVVLLDIEMPGMDGITTTKYINYLSPKTKVIILSSHEDKKFVTQALMAGAKGYILKGSLMNDLKQAILAVHNGYSQVESRLLAQVFNPNNIKTKIKTKTKKSSSQTREANNQTKNRDKVLNKKFNKSTIKNHEKLSSNQNNNKIPLEKKEVTNVQDSSNISNPSHSILLKQTNPEITETESLLLEQEIALDNDPPSYDIPGHPERSSSWANQSDLTPIPEHPLTQYKPSKPSQSKKLLANILLLLNYVQELGNKPKLSQYKTKISRYYKSKITEHKPQISQHKSRLSQYKNSLLLLVDRWRKKGWLWNISLMMLGAAIVLILH